MKLRKRFAAIGAAMMMAFSMMSVGASAALIRTTYVTYGFNNKWEREKEYSLSGTVVAHFVYGYHQTNDEDFAWSKCSTTKNRAIVNNNEDSDTGSTQDAGSIYWSKAFIDHSNGGQAYSIYFAGYNSSTNLQYTLHQTSYYAGNV
ncbi:MAG: hypothetical protein IKO27_04610 [Ruminococcus sp.]|nr:hypothetical protein [Ruminococcus sp.]